MHKMSKESFMSVAAAIFTLVALIHFWVIMTGAVISINGQPLGSWVSYIGFIVAGYMGIVGYTKKK